MIEHCLVTYTDIIAFDFSNMFYNMSLRKYKAFRYHKFANSEAYLILEIYGISYEI